MLFWNTNIFYLLILYISLPSVLCIAYSVQSFFRFSCNNIDESQILCYTYDAIRFGDVHGLPHFYRAVSRAAPAAITWSFAR